MRPRRSCSRAASSRALRVGDRGLEPRLARRRAVEDLGQLGLALGGLDRLLLGRGELVGRRLDLGAERLRLVLGGGDLRVQGVDLLRARARRAGGDDDQRAEQRAPPRRPRSRIDRMSECLPIGCAYGVS